MPSGEPGVPAAIRGGAGPLYPSIVAKSGSAVSLVGNIVNWLGPEKSLAVYAKNGGTSPELLMVWQRKDAVFTAASLTAYLLVFHDMNVRKALCLGQFPIILDILRSDLNDDEKKIGLSNVGQLVLVLVPFVLSAYACLANLDKADMITQVCGVYHAARGLGYLLSPVEASKAWGVTMGGDELHLTLVRRVGVALIGFATLGISLARGVDIFKAIGYGWIPFTVYAIYTTLVVNEKHVKSIFYIWIGLGLAIVGTLAI